MNNNDLIRRGDVFQELDSFLAEVEEKMLSILEQYGACANRATTNCEETAKGVVNNIRERINAIPAAPQPMSAVEYLQTIRRICKSAGSCFDCILIRLPHVCNLAKAEVDKAISVVEKWARDNAERSDEK